jgi:2-oxoglutarate ferredoxin oxidoreductase subunit alpha
MTDLPPDKYLPFKGGKNGVPDFAPMGAGYHTIYSINPHNEAGSIDWDPDDYERLYRRVTGKILDNRNKICRTESNLMDDAEICVIAYGSEVRPALDAVTMARESGRKAGLLKLVTVWPVPEEAIREAAKQSSTVLAVEMNIGKYAGEIERVCGGLCPVVRVTKNRGLVHSPEEIYKSIMEVKI